MVNSYKPQITELFDNARKNGGIEYIYTLLRLSGLSEGEDSFINLKAELEVSKLNAKDHECQTTLKTAVLNEEIFTLLINLISCTYAEGVYNGYPFNKFSEEEYRTNKIIVALIQASRKAKLEVVENMLSNIYCEDIIYYLNHPFFNEISPELEESIKTIWGFYLDLINVYFEMRLFYKNIPKLIKFKHFMVLELLIDDAFGLYGFNMHFSNGSSAQYIRERDRTIIININPISGSPFIGDIRELKNEYIIQGKRLYEVGLPGRYNKLGEWKPICYPADIAFIEQECKSLSENKDVQGAFFYLLCTGHKSLEFVVKTTLELPKEIITVGNSFHLYRCSKELNLGENIQIYDGWYDLKTGDKEDIEVALIEIGLTLNIIGLTYNVSIDWRPKYRISDNSGGVATPKKEDLTLLDSLLKGMKYSDNEMRLLSYALDWYVRGTTSKNIFNSFLSYYISFESIATGIFDGDASFSLNYHSYSKSERKEMAKDCIVKKYDELFQNDPIKFVEESYFTCIQSIKSKTKCIAEHVFGADHEYIKTMFGKNKEGTPSLSTIRSKLAHGDIAHCSWEDEDLVYNNIENIRNISREFIIRIVLKCQPKETIPSWSRTHKKSLSMLDPRCTLCCSEGILPNEADWSIKPDWVD